MLNVRCKVAIVKTLTSLYFLGFSSCLLLFASCNSPQTDGKAGQHKNAGNSGTPGNANRSNATPDSATGRDETLVVSDPLIAKFTGNTGKLEITAGKAAGKVQLKTPSDTLLQLLGKADSTAVAMCKDLSSWSSESAQLRVYSLCDNDLDMRKSIQVIAVNGSPFTTAAGITGESTFSEIKESYPGLQILGKVAKEAGTSKDAASSYIVGDTGKGIAFELSDTTAEGRALGVLVHLPGKSVIATNIPFYPGLEKL